MHAQGRGPRAGPFEWLAAALILKHTVAIQLQVGAYLLMTSVFIKSLRSFGAH
jgi:hypothetical protein